MIIATMGGVGGVTAAPASADEVTATPIASLSGGYGGSDPVGIDIDVSGGRWIVSNNGARYFPRGTTMPSQAIQGGAAGFSIVSDVAVDSNGAAHVLDSGNDSIRIFAPGASGNVAPTRVILGANTAIVSPTSIDVAPTGHIHVSDAGSDALLSFAPSASGNDCPIHRISGSRTQLDGVSGVERRGSLLWAASPEADAAIAFTYGTEGDVGPVRVVGGSRSQLVSPGDLTFDDTVNLHVQNGISSRHVVAFAPAADGNATPLKVVTVAGRSAPPSGMAVDSRRLLHLPNISFSSTDVLPAVVTSAPRSLKVSGSTTSSTRTLTWSAPFADGFTSVTGDEVIVRAGSKVVHRSNRAASPRSSAIPLHARQGDPDGIAARQERHRVHCRREGDLHGR